MNKQQLIDLIIKPVLKELEQVLPGCNTPEAIELLVGIACQESHLGEYIKQLGNGPACGIYQIEPATAIDTHDNYLVYRPELYGIIENFRTQGLHLEDNLIGNLQFQTALARVILWRKPGAIPKDEDGQAWYWKKYWNTDEGKGKVEEYLENKRTYGK